jgi:hypothetical protein
MSLLAATSLLIIALSSAEAAAQQAATKDRSEPRSAHRVAELTWHGDVEITLENAPYEIVVRFNRPIDDAAIQNFAKQIGEDAGDLRWNDSSIVLRPAVGRRVEALVEGRTLRVEFFKDEASAGNATDASLANVTPTEDLEIDLAIAKAQADAAAGYPRRAQRQLVTLAQNKPEDKRIERLLGDAEAADGAVASAARRYRALGATDETAQNIIAEAAGNVSAGLTIRDGKTFSQTEYEAGASIPAGQHLFIGGRLHRFSSRADSVAGPLGFLSNVKARSTIGDLLASIRINPSVRLELKGSNDFGANIAGAGAQAFWGSPEQQLRMTLAYRLPDLSTPEQSVFGGHISRVGIGGSVRLSSSVFVQAEAARNGYGLAGGGARTKTVTTNAGVNFILRRPSPSLSVNYRFDAEYADRTKLRSNGLAFIPLSDREDHTLQVVSSFSLSKLQITGAAGWTANRIGGADGPSVNFSAAARLGRSWRLESSGGVSSISRPGVSGRFTYFRVLLTRFFG